MRASALLAAVALAVGGLAAVAVPVVPANAVVPQASSKLPTTMGDTLVTDYAVPSGALFVATTGSDANPGTANAPFATLYKAMSTVKANGTVVVRGGVYHQGASAATGYNVGGTYYFTPVPQGVTIQAYPGETVWFDGTQRVTKWKKSTKSRYKVSWSTPDFCAQQYYSRSISAQTSSGPCAYSDAIGSGASIGDPQMVFRNDKQLTQVTSLSKLTSSKKFYYDQKKKVLYIRFNPAGDRVELTRYAQAMALYKPISFTLRGIGIRRYASNQFGNATGGAVLLNGGSDVRIERSVFTENAAQGLISWQTARLTVTQSILSANGGNGFGFDGAWRDRGTGSTPTDDLVVEYSRIDGNNTDRFGVNCSYGCSAAGSKVTGAYDITLRFNSFSRNGGGRASGFWCDLHCEGLTAYGNIFDDNDRHGLIYEISERATIASNLFIDNGWRSLAYGGGYGMYIGSASVRVYNNTLVGNRNGVAFYDDPRSASSTGGYDATRVGSDSTGDDFVNNIVSGGSSSGGRQLAISGSNVTVAGNTDADQVVETLASNSYYQPGAQYWLVWTENSGVPAKTFSTVAAVQAAKSQENGSELSTGKVDPYLTDPGAGDWTARAGSTVSGTAADLPEDVAGLLGVPVSGNDRGVLTLGG